MKSTKSPIKNKKGTKVTLSLEDFKAIQSYIKKLKKRIKRQAKMIEYYEK